MVHIEYPVNIFFIIVDIFRKDNNFISMRALIFSHKDASEV